MDTDRGRREGARGSALVPPEVLKRKRRSILDLGTRILNVVNPGGPLHDDSETEDNVVNESEVEWLDTEDDEA